MDKKKKTIIIVVASVIILLGITFGVLFGLGVFNPEEAPPSQVETTAPQKIESSIDVDLFDDQEPTVDSKKQKEATEPTYNKREDIALTIPN